MFISVRLWIRYGTLRIMFVYMFVVRCIEIRNVLENWLRCNSIKIGITDKEELKWSCNVENYASLWKSFWCTFSVTIFQKRSRNFMNKLSFKTFYAERLDRNNPSYKQSGTEIKSWNTKSATYHTLRQVTKPQFQTRIYNAKK